MTDCVFALMLDYNVCCVTDTWEAAKHQQRAAEHPLAVHARLAWRGPLAPPLRLGGLAGWGAQ